MIKQLITLVLFCSIAFLNGHIRFLNTTNQNLFIVDVQLKKSYQVDSQQETVLITTATASHFLIYPNTDETIDIQNNELPLFSFGTTDHMHIHPTPTITSEDLAESHLPENVFLIPSSIKRGQAINLITKPIRHCSKCEERRKERQAQAEKLNQTNR
jgi:hypothetical protein